MGLGARPYATDALMRDGSSILTPEELRSFTELAFIPAQTGLSNPVDMITSATPEQYVRTIEVVWS